MDQIGPADASTVAPNKNDDGALMNAEVEAGRVNLFCDYHLTNRRWMWW